MHLPHLAPFQNCPLCFFTAATARRQPILASETVMHVLREVWTKSATADGWFVGRFVIMPDHVHFFAMPALEARSRSAWCKTWKSVTSRRISAVTTVPPPIWQPDTFDHILRNAESYAEKWEYVRANPVRAGFVSVPELWPYQGEIHSLSF
ncbi:REP-associated tyrosine transposase [Horticoccus sp. 23ND18S-11]|uniref:REP-associated tyrosine transposase n=1 Tax=Horticoccus sp. 23ND18S-11 TaxID=3391832 RepID=UPI0039C9C6BC